MLEGIAPSFAESAPSPKEMDKESTFSATTVEATVDTEEPRPVLEKENTGSRALPDCITPLQGNDQATVAKPPVDSVEYKKADLDALFASVKVSTVTSKSSKGLNSGSATQRKTAAPHRVTKPLSSSRLYRPTVASAAASRGFANKASDSSTTKTMDNRTHQATTNSKTSFHSSFRSPSSAPHYALPTASSKTLETFPRPSENNNSKKSFASTYKPTRVASGNNGAPHYALPTASSKTMGSVTTSSNHDNRSNGKPVNATNKTSPRFVVDAKGGAPHYAVPTASSKNSGARRRQQQRSTASDITNNSKLSGTTDPTTRTIGERGAPRFAVPTVSSRVHRAHEPSSPSSSTTTTTTTTHSSTLTTSRDTTSHRPFDSKKMHVGKTDTKE